MQRFDWESQSDTRRWSMPILGLRNGFTTTLKPTSILLTGRGSRWKRLSGRCGELAPRFPRKFQLVPLPRFAASTQILDYVRPMAWNMRCFSTRGAIETKEPIMVTGGGEGKQKPGRRPLRSSGAINGYSRAPWLICEPERCHVRQTIQSARRRVWMKPAVGSVNDRGNRHGCLPQWGQFDCLIAARICVYYRFSPLPASRRQPRKRIPGFIISRAVRFLGRGIVVTEILLMIATKPSAMPASFPRSVTAISDLG